MKTYEVELIPTENLPHKEPCWLRVTSDSLEEVEESVNLLAAVQAGFRIVGRVRPLLRQEVPE